MSTQVLVFSELNPEAPIPTVARMTKIGHSTCWFRRLAETIFQSFAKAKRLLCQSSTCEPQDGGELRSVAVAIWSNVSLSLVHRTPGIRRVEYVDR